MYLLYLSLLLTASAVYIPLQPRTGPGSCAADLDIAEGNDGPTADGSAGIGVELESPSVQFQSQGCSEADRDAARKQMVGGRKGTNWVLTADSSPETDEINIEYILSGQNIKVGSGDAKRGGAAVAQDITSWQPWKENPKAQVNVDNNKCNPWTLKNPSPKQNIETLPWEPQVTTPMPLEAVYMLMENSVTSTYPFFPLTGFGSSELPVLVTKKYFQSNPNGISSSEVTDDILGFCSLILTFAKNAQTQLNKNESPKLRVGFMPRTEFNTVFQQVKSKMSGDLFSLFNILSCYMPDKKNVGEVVIDKNFCTGQVNSPKPGTQFANLAYSFKDSSVPPMNIKDWIEGIGKGSPSTDLLTTFDKNIDSSIGGLGAKMEKMFNSQRSVPLFEFRGLDTQYSQTIEDWMDKLDSYIQQVHRTYASPPQMRKRQAFSNCTLTNTTSQSSSPSPTPTPKVSCVYQDSTPEVPQAECICASGSSTITVKPMSNSSLSVITQSCDYTTWPSSRPTVTAPPQTTSTDFAGCQVCTLDGTNNAECSPLPSSLGCTAQKPRTIMSGDTSAITIGTLTGSALFSAITSGIDKVCEVPPNTGGATGSFTCSESATATIASNVLYTDISGSQTDWQTDGELTLKVTEGNYDSLEWYSVSKAAIAAYAQNSTQGNCKNLTADTQSNSIWERQTPSLMPGPVNKMINVCNMGSQFQIIEVDPGLNTTTRELAFEIAFQGDAEDNLACEFVEFVAEFAETVVSAVTDTEVALPEEFEVDQLLLQACEGNK